MHIDLCNPERGGGAMSGSGVVVVHTDFQNSECLSYTILWFLFLFLHFTSFRFYSGLKDICDYSDMK